MSVSQQRAGPSEAHGSERGGEKSSFLSPIHLLLVEEHHA